jgi:hypothetical protein
MNSMPPPDAAPPPEEQKTDARFRAATWDADGIAAIEASGSDVRATLEAGLRAALALAGHPAAAPASHRASPIRGEGDDPAALFVDLLADVREALAYSPSACRDIVLDGVLRRGDGYIAWGRALEAAAPAPGRPLPVVHRAPTIARVANGFVLRATLARDEA